MINSRYFASDVKLESEYTSYRMYSYCCLKKIMNASRPSEHPPVRGKKCQNI